MVKYSSTVGQFAPSRVRTIMLAVALVTTGSTMAFAQTDKPSTLQDQDGFTASFGVGAGRNSLRGISEKVKAFPLFSIDWQGGPFFAGLSRGVGYNWTKSDALTVSTAFTGAGGRREKDSTRFKGLGDIKNSVAANLAVEWTPDGSPVGLQAGVTKAFGKNLGTVYNFGLGTGFPLNDKLSMNASLMANYADKKRMQTHYGITAVQAINSGYQAFTTKAGIESVDIGVGLSYALDKKWTLSSNIGANRLQGEAAKSQIFKAKTTAVGSFVATYRF